MALDTGMGTPHQVPRAPKPQVSYGAPSGPYAGPVQSFASPHPSPVMMRGPQPGSLAVPYGYNPVQQGDTFAQAPPPGFVPHGGQSGADLLAEQQRALSGYKRSFGYGTGDDVRGDIANLMALVPGPPFKGGQAVPDMMQIIKGYIGQNKAATAAERIKRATSSPVTNPELLPQMGQHAALAEAIIANKAFDRILAEQKRVADLQKAPSLGEILRMKAEGM